MPDPSVCLGVIVGRAKNGAYHHVPHAQVGAPASAEPAVLRSSTTASTGAADGQSFKASSPRNIFASDWSSPQAIAGFCWTSGRKSQ